MQTRSNRHRKFLITRRGLLKAGAATVGGLGLTRRARPARVAHAAALPGGTLDPASIPKYVEELLIPPAMPTSGKITVRDGKNMDYYEIAMRQFRQQILPSGLPQTTVWSYGSVSHPGTVAEGGTFNYPAFTIEATWRQEIRVKWINDLKDASGNVLPHLLPVDPTLHWANPPGGTAGRDTRPTLESTPGPYIGPVPIVTHLHGAEGVGPESDGFPEAWYLPDANNIPADHATTGTLYDFFRAQALETFGVEWEPGTAVFQYPNDQRATTLWFHDHALGITRLNVYAGPAGFYLLRGGPDDQVRDNRNPNSPGKLPGPAPMLPNPPGRQIYEIPLVIQDRSFDEDGSLFYPDSREFFDDFQGPFRPESDVPPIWNPEFFGNTMVVNGKTWPLLRTEKRRYRFRVLNGCNSRFLKLKFQHMPKESQDPVDVDVWIIGSDGGFLPHPVPLESCPGGTLLMGPAERYDIIADFTKVPAGDDVLLLNEGPDAPFTGMETNQADPETTGQVMKFSIVPRHGADQSTPPEHLELPAIADLSGGQERPLALVEGGATVDGVTVPAAALLGGVEDASPVPKLWGEPITENPAAGSTEVWELYNFTADAHPIHIHGVQFQVVGRRPFDPQTLQPTGEIQGPRPGEEGFKDTVIAGPGEITLVRVPFGTPGLFVWHCHILEHEDNEMMRPYLIGEPPPGLPFDLE